MKYLMTALITMFLAATAQSATAQSDEVTLSSDNTLVLNRAFTRSNVTKLMEEASDMDANLKSGYPIYLFLYTPGGSIQSGLELIEFFNGLNRPVHTVTLFSASMGFQAVQHLGKRYIMKYGVLMSHKARGTFSGEFGGGISQLDSRYQLWLRRIEMMDRQTVKRTEGKQTMESYTDAYTPELWLNGNEAVKKGYADKVVTVKCDLSMKGTKTSTIDLGFISLVVETSDCPLKTGPVSIKAKILTNKGEMFLEDFLKKDGKFGENCGKNNEEERDYVYYSGFEEERRNKNNTTNEEELCSKDKNLTLQKIREYIDKKRKYLNRDLRDNIIYSY